MDDRVGQVLDHGLVNFRLFTHQHEFDILAQTAGKVTRDARILLEQATNRLHAGFHYRVLQIRHQQIKLAHRLIKCVKRLRIRTTIENIRTQCIQTILGQADLARQVEHLVKPRGIDPN